MKKIYLVILLFTGLAAKGQYFMHMYGDPATDYIYPAHGINTRNIAYGHLMAGVSDQGVPGALVTFTDENGTPFFNNVYTIDKGGFQGGAFRNYVFEWDHAPNIGVIGMSEQFCLETVFYMQLDAAGNVLNLFEYELNQPSITGTQWYVREIHKIAESQDGNYVYVSGMAIPVPGYQNVDFFVLKIEVATGNLIWSNVYDFGYSRADGGSWDQPEDLIESPYLPPSGIPDLVVVGEYRDMNPSSYEPEGFFMRINSATGAPIGDAKRYNSTKVSVSSDRFRAITIANNPFPGQPGFMIAGESQESIARGTWDMADMWSLKVDRLGNVIKQNLYGSASGDYDEAYDVIERLNPFTGRFEYYYCGYKGNNTGTPDLIVIKTDDMGNVVANGQIMHDFLETTYGLELDQFNNDGPNMLNGLSIYGSTYGAAYGTSQLLHIKTYFNGFMECNDWRTTPIMFSGPGFTGRTPIYTTTDFSQINTLTVTQRPAPDQNICFNPSVPGGSNASIAPVEPQGDKQATIAPNPMAQGAPAAIIELDAPSNTEVNVAIYDMLGKEYYSGSFTLAFGKNRLPVDVSNAGMAAGMYTVKISGQAINKNILLIVK